MYSRPLPVQLDRRQRRIAERLTRLVGPGASAFFRDACLLMAEPTRFESTTHLVAHLIREIESALRNVVGIVADQRGESESPPLSLEQVVGALIRRIDCVLHRALAKLGHGGDRPPDRTRPSQADEIRAILVALDLPIDGVVARAWLEHTTGRGSLHGRAHRRQLLAPRNVDPDFNAFWDDMQAVLDATLEQFEKRFVEVHKIIDQLLAKTQPTAQDVKTLKERIPNNPVGQGFFLEHLVHHAWLPALGKAGFFSDPPSAVHDRVAGSVTFPAWPAGRYLARIAKTPAAQSAVLKVVLSVPPTDNAQVHERLADVALSLPPRLGKQLVASAKEWISFPQYGLLCDKLADLLVILARGGETEAAAELATELLGVVPNETNMHRRHRGVHGHVDDYRYARLLDKCRPALADAVPLKALDVFCGLLDRALDEDGRSLGAKDHSSIWYPAIEDDPGDHSASIEENLVVAVRECARRVVTGDSSFLPEVIRRLEGNPRFIFRRLALTILAEHPAENLRLVEERLLDESRFNDQGQRHEYMRLFACSFRFVSDRTRKTLLSWIDAAAEPQADAERWTREQGVPISSEEIARDRRVWQRDRLAPLKDVLPADWRSRYDELVASEGEPPSTGSRTLTFVGPTSPTAAKEISALTVPQVVEHLRTWTPASDWMSPSREGLGRQLAVAVALDPARFADAANSFIGLDPTYLSGLLRGMHDGLKAGRGFEWGRILDLADWIVRQPRSAGDEDLPMMDADPHWGWARKALAGLFRIGFQSEINEIPASLRERVWAVISKLIEDPDPRPKDEERFGGTNMDPPTLSMNTTRGEAMYALIDYAVWVRRTISGPERIDFGDMPEVQAALDAHLDLSREPAICIRAIYGWHFPTLLSLDRAWLQDRLPRIFPAEPEHRAHRNAAWESYLAFNDSWPETWALLEAQYRRAIEELPQGREKPIRTALGADSIVQHVILLYWRGLQDLAPGSLVARFFDVAPEELRHEALDYVGRSLENDRADVPQEVVERLKVLWEERLRIGTANPASHAKELSAVSWWTKASRLDLDWRLAQLLRVLQVFGRVDLSFLVLEFLSEVVVVRPRQALACLEAMVNGEPDPWDPSMWSTEARTVLSRALESGDADAVRGARELISVFAAKGFPGYKDLLSEDAA